MRVPLIPYNYVNWILYVVYTRVHKAPGISCISWFVSSEMSRYSYAVPRSRDDAHEAIVGRKIGKMEVMKLRSSGSLDRLDIAWSDFESALQHETLRCSI